MKSCDFSWALRELKHGYKISRHGWNGKDMWVTFSPGFTLTSDRIFSEAIKKEVGSDEGVFRPYLMMRTVDGEFVPWVASQSDLLAEDWFLV
jgi:Protein of unknown function (DUF2829)